VAGAARLLGERVGGGREVSGLRRVSKPSRIVCRSKLEVLSGSAGSGLRLWW
jgi:hypothetical protein